MEKNEANLKKLCNVIWLKASKKENDIFKWSLLEHRISEAKAFKMQKKMLSLFCDHLKGHSSVVKGNSRVL